MRLASLGVMIPARCPSLNTSARWPTPSVRRGSPGGFPEAESGHAASQDVGLRRAG